MNANVRSPSAAARYDADQVAAALDHHARLNRRAISILSIEYSQDGSRTWTVEFADEARIVTQEWIEDPRQTETVKTDIFHAGVRLGLKG